MMASVLAGMALSAAQAPSARDSSQHPVVWTPLATLVDSAVAAGAASGAVVAVSAGGARYVHTSGRLGVADSTRTRAATLYDLASLTKVVGLTTGLMLAVAERRLILDEAVRRYVPAFQGTDKDRVTVRHLLTHSSGLPAHRRLWEEAVAAQDALALVDATPLDTVPGARTVYSDLGAMVLTQALERVTGEPLDTYLARRVFQPLGMWSTMFRPPRHRLPDVAPTERDPWRGRELRGEVHDENAAWLGGVSGHAGLFSNAEDLLTFGEWLLGSLDGDGRGSTHPGDDRLPVPAEVAREFTRRQDLVVGSSRALGWDTPSENSSAGTRLSPASFGHTGFTGTSIWLDPARRLVIVLLTNRVNPTRNNNQHVPLRRAVADLVADLVDASSLVDMSRP